MKKKQIAYCAIVMAVCAVLNLPMASEAAAQGRAGGRYYSKGDVDRLIKRAEERSDAFQKQVDRALDRGRLDGTGREDRINDEIKDLEKALDRLREEFDRSDRWQSTRADVARCLDEAREVNVAVRASFLRRDIERSWQALKNDLNRLASVYDLPRLR